MLTPSVVVTRVAVWAMRMTVVFLFVGRLAHDQHLHLEVERFAGERVLAVDEDLVAFDAEKIGTTNAERVWDFPNHTDRLVSYGTGIEHVWVNGIPIRSYGNDIDDVAPGMRLRNTVRSPL